MPHRDLILFFREHHDAMMKVAHLSCIQQPSFHPPSFLLLTEVQLCLFCVQLFDEPNNRMVSPKTKQHGSALFDLNADAEAETDCALFDLNRDVDDLPSSVKPVP